MKISDSERKIAHLTLRSIFDDDPKIFLDPSNLRGYLSDVFRGEARVKRILKEAVSENIAHKIWTFNELDEADRQMKIDMLKLTFREEHFFRTAISDYIIDSFVYAVGWKEQLDEFVEEKSEDIIQFKGLKSKQLSDGDYLGELNEEDERSGFGLFEREDGVTYAGEWRVNYYNGCGIVIDPNNNEKYAGEWRMNKPTGVGVKLQKDGTKCVGEWRNGKQRGMGISYLPNGNCRMGRYVDGILNGYGMLVYNAEEYIVGEFQNGNLCGKCLHIYRDGHAEEEIWKEGIKI